MDVKNFDHTITWSEFNQQAARLPGSNEDANIKINFPHSYNFGSRKNEVIVDSAEINLATDINECWVVSSKMTSDLLNHEQGHYDITAIGARDLYHKMKSLSAKSDYDLEKDIKSENAKIQQSINATNIRYDLQTNHSQNVDKQKVWDKKIKSVKKNKKGSIGDLPG